MVKEVVSFGVRLLQHHLLVVLHQVVGGRARVRAALGSNLTRIAARRFLQLFGQFCERHRSTNRQIRTFFVAPVFFKLRQKMIDYFCFSWNELFAQHQFFIDEEDCLTKEFLWWKSVLQSCEISHKKYRSIADFIEISNIYVFFWSRNPKKSSSVSEIWKVLKFTDL